MDLSRFFTFDLAKSMARHRWFYYKEGFSPQLVEVLLEDAKSLYDPFCGVGTSLVVAGEKGIDAIGIDVSPLSVLASKVKTRNYEEDMMEIARDVVRCKEKVGWRFELFAPEKIFPYKNYLDFCRIRKGIEGIVDERIREFLLLALVSIIPQCSFVVKDGGVLKIKKRHVPRAKLMFLRKVRKMVDDLKVKIKGNVDVKQENAKTFAPRKVDLIISSPPYLNNVDYSKIYGLEISLLTLNEFSTKKMRKALITSFKKQVNVDEDFRKLMIEKGLEDYAKYDIVVNYLKDMYLVMENLVKCSERMFFVIGDSFIAPEIVPIAKLLMWIGEEFGLESKLVCSKWRKVVFGKQSKRLGEHLISFFR